ncbi:hypothetical protein VTK56DRAFT_9682 [Thermocarpiscus australiensis]
MWTDIHTLPETNRLRNATSRIRKFRRSYRSPLYQVADVLKDVSLESLETISPFVLEPWQGRVDTNVDETAAAQMETDCAVQIAVSSSGRNNKVGMGGVVHIPLSIPDGPRDDTFNLTLGPGTEQNPYSAELAAVGHALRLLRNVRYQRIILATSNKAAVLTLKNPCQQSGQQYIREAYPAVKVVRRRREHYIYRLDTNNRRERTPEDSQGESKGGNSTECYTTSPGIRNAINNPPYSMGQTDIAQNPAGQSRQTL